MNISEAIEKFVDKLVQLKGEDQCEVVDLIQSLCVTADPNDLYEFKMQLLELFARKQEVQEPKNVLAFPTPGQPENLPRP